MTRDATAAVLRVLTDPISLVGAAIVIGWLWLTQSRAGASREPSPTPSPAAAVEQ
jgi:hypothetical protein